MLAVILYVVAIVLGVPVIWEVAQTGLVPRFPTAILDSSLALLGTLALVIGLVLDGVLLARRDKHDCATCSTRLLAD
ncbi:MAG TPA: hypothetical protein VIL68_14295 [Propionibacteriaceae bacterium]